MSVSYGFKKTDLDGGRGLVNHVVCVFLPHDYLIKDDRTGQNKHELLQYSVRTINNSKVSRLTYPRKMHALYEKLV